MRRILIQGLKSQHHENNATQVRSEKLPSWWLRYSANGDCEDGAEVRTVYDSILLAETGFPTDRYLIDTLLEIHSVKEGTTFKRIAKDHEM
jgi:hypothetical protein